MTITVTFNPPLPSDSPSTFNTKAFTLLGDLNDWSTEANALAAGINVDEAALDAAVLAASGSASSASSSAGSATTSAGTATTQAGIATTKAGEANASAIAAAAAAASVNLGNVDINGGTIDGTVIGGSSAAAGSFTSVSSSSGLFDTSGTLSLYRISGISYLDWASGQSLRLSTATSSGGAGRVAIADFSSTGLSVTGALSATGFTLDASGNLGIGVTPSAWTFNSKASQVGVYASVVSDIYNGHTVLGHNFYNDTNTSSRYIGATAAHKISMGGNGIMFSTAPSGTAGDPISFTTAMTLDASGNLIQTVNSTAPTLTVNKTLAFELTSDTQLKIKVRGSDGVTRSTTLTLA